MFTYSDEQLKAEIMLNLARKNCFGGKHTAAENMFRGLDQRRLGKEGLKRARNLANELIKQGFIFTKPAHYGLQVSLNPAKSKEIKEIIRQQLGIDI